MKIFNARLFDAQSGSRAACLEVAEGCIQQIHLGDAGKRSQTEDLDAGGLIVSPGWIDLQINGGFGMDFTTDPSCVWEVGARLPRYGVTAFLPTIITSPADVYRQALAVSLDKPPAGYRGARPLGWHFEGPFLNLAKKGAHNPDCLRQPDAEFTAGWSRASGVTLVTMAPELPGALQLARSLSAAGVVLSAGHSTATLEEAGRALDAGYRAATHLFNAMPPLDHRSPGLAAAALLEPGWTPSLIADGVHVHPDMIKLAWRLCSADRLALITDAVGALGMPPGPFLQGGMEIIVGDDAARLPNGTLAGSTLSLEKALRNMMAFTGEPMEKVLPALSSIQARLLGLDDLGALRPGCRADFTLLDESARVQMTLVGGEVVFNRCELVISTGAQGGHS